MAPIKAAVIGAGFIGPAHIDALRRLGVEVAGIAAGDPERAQARAEQLGVSRAYKSYREALDDPGVTSVHICTPNRTHYPIVKEALAAGKHVICEKPLARTVEEADQLVRLAAQSGLVNAVNFNIRYYPLVHEMRQRVQSGELGRVFLVQGSYLQDWLAEETDWNWRIEPEVGGELRVVSDIGSHWLDLAGFIAGKRLQAVCADLTTFLPVRKKPLRPSDTFAGQAPRPEDFEERQVTTEDFAAVLLRYEDGVRGIMCAGQVCMGHKNSLRIEINGSRGSLLWESEQPNELWIGHRGRANEVLAKDPVLLSTAAQPWASYPGGHAEGYPDTMRQLFKAVYAAIAGDTSVQYPTFADGAEEQRIGDAIAESATTGRWVEVKRLSG